MAHMIDLSNARENMAYVGSRPWHGLGQELTRGADLAVWQKEAGLDWTAEVSPAWFLPAGSSEQAEVGDHIEIPNTKVIHRSDTAAVLGVMSDRYRIVQPGEALEFFGEFVAAGDMELETAGSLDGGRRIWALARVGDDLVVKGQDRIEGFLLLATSFDGSMATTAKYTTVRVVCQNTLHMADADNRQPTVRIPHSTVFDADSVKAELGLRQRAWADFGDLVNALADRKVDRFEARNWLIEVFGNPEKPLEEQDEADAKLMKRVWEAVEGGKGQNLRSADGTAWGLLNGVTYFEDHVRRFRGDNNRLASAWFGGAADRKARALGAALKLVA